MKKRIKILYGLEATEGGAAIHLRLLATGINAGQFDVTIMASNKRAGLLPNYFEDLKEKGIRVEILEMHRGINPWRDFKSLLKIFLHMRREKYDLIHTHSSKAGALFRIAAWLNQVPFVVYTPHTFYFQGKSGSSRYFFLLLERLMGKISDKVVAVSPSEKKLMIDSRIVPPDKIVLIENGIDPVEFCSTISAAKARQQLGLPGNAKVIGGIGRFAFQKDWLTFIRATSKVKQQAPEVFFLIVGAAGGKKEIENWASQYKLNGNVILEEITNQVSERFAAMDIFLNSSRWEGLPYTILEAMALKIPVVASEVPGNMDLIRHNHNGLLYPAGDVDSAANCLLQLLDDDTRCKKFGEVSYAHVHKKYSLEKFIRRHESLYQIAKRTTNIKIKLSN